VQSGAVCCRVLQCVAVCCSVLQHTHLTQLENHFVDFVPLFRCVAVSCSVLRCGAVWCRVVQCVAVCCSVLQCVATHTPQSTRELSAQARGRAGVEAPLDKLVYTPGFFFSDM